jgi:MYXO-CTERM domain-containing protein
VEEVTPDAGVPDAGPDAGTDSGPGDDGCGCAQPGPGAPAVPLGVLLIGLMALCWIRRRG